MTSRGRELVKMTDAEVEDFLTTSKKVQVATVNPDGSPHLTTLFYVVQDGRIAFWTYGRSQKIKNLQRDPRITCLVETGDDYFELRGVSISGHAEIVTDEAGIREIGTSVASRMVDGADLGDIGRDEVERQVRKRVGVVVVPRKTASWDHRKMLAPAESDAAS
ncbi:MAG TPA: pyridoxamine 5'-phosphate oxidase family protein [Nocardioidaceae bacterium]